MTPRGLDRNVIIEHLQMLEQNLFELESFRHLAYEEFVLSSRYYWAVERGLQLCIQNLLDIGAHLLSGLGLAAPAEYREVINGLGKHGIIPEDFAAKIAPMAGFRNILVHEYLKVDLRQVYTKLQYGLEDFRLFAVYIVRFLNKLP